jgi:hypothetical protein
MTTSTTHRRTASGRGPKIPLKSPLAMPSAEPNRPGMRALVPTNSGIPSATPGKSGGSEGDLMRLNGWKSRQMVDRYADDVANQRALEAKRRRGDMI